jgi:hypothetical protein
MYSNIGGKLKTLAKVVALIGTIISVIVAFYCFNLYDKSRVYIGNVVQDVNNGLLLAGFSFLIIGSLFSWVSSLGLYGFGELIEKTTEIARNTAKCGSVTHSRTSTDEKMKTLISWHENELISDDEFEIKSRELLNGG